jgi:O-antigen/teichoic acid export membrane protein
MNGNVLSDRHANLPSPGRNPFSRRRIVELLSVAGPKFSNGAAVLAINVLLLRFLNAEQLAAVSLCIAGILLADSIVGSAMDMGTLRLASGTVSASESSHIQQQALYLKLLACGVAFVCFGVFGNRLWHELTREDNGRSLLLLSCFAASGLLLLRSAQIQVQIERRFGRYGLLDLAHTVLRFGGVAVLMTLRRVTPFSVMCCFAAAPLPVCAYWLLTRGRELFRGSSLDLLALKSVFRYVRWFLLTFALGAIISRIDLFLVSRWSSMRQAGMLSAAQVFALVPQMLGLYLSVLVGPRIMPQIKQGTFWDFFRRTQTLLLVAAAGFYLAFAVSWPLWSSHLLPHKFADSGAIIQVLMPGALAGLATFPLTLAFVVFTRPRFLFTMDCISLPGLAVAYYLAIPRYGAMGAAVVTTSVNVLRAAIAQGMAWKWARQTKSETELPSVLAAETQLQMAAEQT